eukprot:GHVP01060904.1.p1 GENE.GHVP01060904.1~~GHVP01060904.1.p1  ORF type:complete len:366 (+),score=55.36 GHVP01060904.1:142-1239(+)
MFPKLLKIFPIKYSILSVYVGIVTFCIFSHIKTYQHHRAFEKLPLAQQQSFKCFQRLDTWTSLLEYFVGVTILGPFRIVFFLTIAAISLVVSAIVVASTEKHHGDAFVRRALKWDTSIVFSVLRTQIRCYKAEEKNDGTYEKTPLELIKLKGMVVANHVSATDILAMANQIEPSFVSKEEVKKLPFIGQFARVLRCVFVSRLKGNSLAKDQIKVWLKEYGTKRPMMIFPEGTTSNGNGILSFAKAGAFESDEVTPIVLHYKCSGFHPAYDTLLFFYWWTAYMCSTRASELQFVVMPKETKRSLSPEEFGDLVHEKMERCLTSILKEEQKSSWIYKELLTHDKEKNSPVPFKRKVQLLDLYNGKEL